MKICMHVCKDMTYAFGCVFNQSASGTCKDRGDTAEKLHELALIVPFF